jgi:hypothetical protein
MAKRKPRQDKAVATPGRDDVVSMLRASHGNASDAKINALVERVIELAQLEPDEVMDLVDSDSGTEFLDVKELGLEQDPKTLLRPWKSIKRASPKPLTDEEYKRFLQGLDPIAGETTELEVYGSHLK